MSGIQIKQNDRYGSLTVIRDTGKKDSHGKSIWLCQCDCGNLVEKSSRYLLRKELKTHSCGCQMGVAKIKHGDKRKLKKTARLYSIWSGMRWRCNKNNHTRRNHAEKGVSICDEWLDYRVFKSWAMENGYSDGLTIDRIDNNGNYEPSNCRWATAVEQANNKSNNHLITYRGRTMTLAEWARELGINYSTLRSRFNRQKLSPEEAFAMSTETRETT